MPGRLESALMSDQEQKPQQSPLSKLRKMLMGQEEAETVIPTASQTEAAAPAMTDTSSEGQSNSLESARQKAVEILTQDPENPFAKRILERIGQIEAARGTTQPEQPVLNTMQDRADRLAASGGNKAGGMFDFIYKQRMARQNQLEGMDE